MAFELKLNISLCLENLLRDQQNMAPDRMHLDLASDLRLKDLHMNPGGVLPMPLSPLVKTLYSVSRSG
jgi:hypothetical protein|uniref:Uncharacterized protein n=2 Tax=Picea TaxID=3328 RepID=A0A117NGW2_PICGL|nr:hypothetical protein ABT39_MTgene5547 [Picea glauca]QHR91660.1 hypothetical protein Q903MT_gene5696 [Picea sitchensis]